METNSSIGMYLPDGRVRGVYCHCAGSVESVGQMLKSCFYLYSDVEDLISFGDIIVLKRCVDDTAYYDRDREDKTCRPLLFKDVAEFHSNYPTAPFSYLFKDGSWLVRKSGQQNWEPY